MKSKPAPTLLLASNSSRRLELLSQISIRPAQAIPSEFDETPLLNESPKNLAKRLSLEKARSVFDQNSGHFVLGADTVVACGRKVLDKAKNEDIARKNLKNLSGRRHRVYGAISLITPDNREFTRECMTIIQFKPLTERDIDSYLQSGEWQDKAGSYAIQGHAGAFVKFISGSYSNVVGLSLYDTIKILESGGFSPTS